MRTDNIRMTKRRHAPDWLALDSVTSVGVVEHEDSFAIRVTYKGDSPPEEIPNEIENWTVIFEQREYQPSSVQGAAFDSEETERHRPVKPGISHGHSVNEGACTIGYLAEDPETNDQYFLTNNHCLINPPEGEGGQVGDDIVQPALSDGGTHPDDAIGQIEGYVELSQDVANYADVAWFSVDTDFTREFHQLGEAPIGPTKHPELRDPVVMVGRTSGVQEGQVTAIDIDVHIDGYGIFLNQFETDVTAQDGDSGAAILYDGENGYRPMGLHFARNPNGGEPIHNNAARVELESGLVIDKKGEDTSTDTVRIQECGIMDSSVPQGENSHVYVYLENTYDSEVIVTVDVYSEKGGTIQYEFPISPGLNNETLEYELFFEPGEYDMYVDVVDVVVA